MNTLDPRAAARAAVAPNPSRPATAVVHDTDDLRLVVFRLDAGQVVPPHRSVSSVMLTVLEGEGVLSGEDKDVPVDVPCKPGDVVTYAPNELHGMRAGSGELLLLATITPRPGSR
jgi:quercetin dioxygenase-like cupin family protein